MIHYEIIGKIIETLDEASDPRGDMILFYLNGLECQITQQDVAHLLCCACIFYNYQQWIDTGEHWQVLYSLRYTQISKNIHKIEYVVNT